EIRRGIAPSILWAAITTIAAFLVLNFGGLPGLAQLGSLVAIGVVLSALVMIFAFLPPLFPDRRNSPGSAGVSSASSPNPVQETRRRDAGAPGAARIKLVFAISAALIVFCVVTLLSGLPQMDGSSTALQPRDSQAYAALEAIKDNLNQKRDPLWLVVAGRNESEVARRLDAVQPALNQAVSNGVLGGFTIPTMLWPRPESQSVNRATVQQLVARREAFHTAAFAGGFSTDALGLTDSLLDTWQRASMTTNVFWPTNALCSWILDKLVAREVTNFYAVGFLFPPTNSMNASALAELGTQLPQGGVWLAGWELLGGTVLGVVKQNMWKLVLPMMGLVLLSLWFAFRQLPEIILSLGILFISGLCLLAVMRLAGWSWNLLSLMAVPLILGTGVDYSLFMQLALRRHHGDLLVAHQSVGRALLLCGGTAVAGFGSLGLSSNAGMASLGRVCAVGIAANMLISVFLLPVWWRTFASGKCESPDVPRTTPSSLYGAKLWWLGLVVARWLPMGVCETLARTAGSIYWLIAPHRREVVIQNLLPVLNGDRPAAEKAARTLFTNFAIKVADLWHFESGTAVDRWLGEWNGWEVFQSASGRGRGVLFVTPHLGNWEFGGAFMVKKGVKMLVLTQAEPDERLTELRQSSRARWGIETLVVGQDAFAFVEIIKRLNEGATVALLVDRPPAPTAVTVELFGRPFQASNAAAELARASGCAIVPVQVVRKDGHYSAQILPEIQYDRGAIGSREARVQLTQEILRAFEPSIRQHVEQWYHFVPVWTMGKKLQPPTSKLQ
ncbi:MAG: MMPL family transporter, partial [Verrucomicrobia bacterium]|nr:MMPL family transporter [Verrucomicrobiota bacterium]